VILSDSEIRKAIKERKIIVEPTPDEEQIQTSALDLRLGQEIRIFKSTQELEESEPSGVLRPVIIDSFKIDILEYIDKYTKLVQLNADGSFTLVPHQFILGITHEFISLPREAKIAARVEGRSTLARLGLQIHMTAPTIHSGFNGRIALEIYNYGPHPIALHPLKLRICQLVFERLGTKLKGQLKTVFLGTQHLGKKRS
jgi:dCTP deaminase